MTKVSAGQHLKELRTRSLIVAIFFIVGACLAYSFQPQVVAAVLAPLHGAKLVYLNPAGGFNFIFLISIYAGLALAIPVLIQQLYAFVRPALPDTAKKRSSTLIIGSMILLVAGILFGYFIAVPNALAFLYSFADQYINSSLTADSYLNFIIAYTIGIGLVFQIPLLLLLVNSIKPLTPGGLMKSEKWVLLISVIIAAIITPTPDPINQLIIAGPVIIVYQIGVVIILVSLSKKHRANKRLAKQAARGKSVPVAGLKPNPVPHHAPQPSLRPAAAMVAAVSTAAPSPHYAQHGLHSMQGMQQVKRVQKQPQPIVTRPVRAHATPIHHQSAQVSSQRSQPVAQGAIDGFKRPSRPVTQSLVVPARNTPARQPVARPVPRPASPNQRNFTIDGMYRPFSPNQIITN